MYNSQTVVDRIKNRTREIGHTMVDFNAHCQIDKSTINMSAQKKYGLSAKILYDAADFLGCSVDYLLGRTDTPDNSPAAITAGDNTHINNIVNSSNFNISEYNSDDIALLHLIQKMPLIERAKLICELNDKYNVEK